MVYIVSYRSARAILQAGCSWNWWHLWEELAVLPRLEGRKTGRWGAQLTWAAHIWVGCAWWSQVPKWNWRQTVGVEVECKQVECSKGWGRGIAEVWSQPGLHSEILSLNRVAVRRWQKYISKYFTSFPSAHKWMPNTFYDTLNDFSYGARDGPRALPRPRCVPPHLDLPDALSV